MVLFWIMAICTASYLTVPLFRALRNPDHRIRDVNVKEKIATSSSPDTRKFEGNLSKVDSLNNELKTNEEEKLQLPLPEVNTETLTKTVTPVVSRQPLLPNRFPSLEKVMEYRWMRFNNSRKRGVRRGPGEMGAEVVLTSEEKDLADQLFDKEFFNVVVSDKIALDRSIPDYRYLE